MNINYDKRPWGLEEILTLNEQSTVKILTINSGQKTSLQYHHHRKEFWKLIEGEALFQIGSDIITPKIGDEHEIPQGINHRLIGTSTGSGKILEISFGVFDENDIVRIEDDYGRV